MFSNYVWCPHISYFVHSIVKTVEMMVQRVDFERNLKNIRPATVHVLFSCFCLVCGSFYRRFKQNPDM